MATKNINIANPQGKASLTLLNDLNNFSAVEVKRKDVPRWLTDFFTSILVLSAKFSFKPVINKNYYMYFDNGQWKLSLIEPHAWTKCPYEFFAACQLHKDKSWSIAPADDWEKNNNLRDSINKMREEFFDVLNTDNPIVDTLPYYAGHLPYYQRVAANGLAKSLALSLKLNIGAENSKLVCGKELINHLMRCDHQTKSLLNAH